MVMAHRRHVPLGAADQAAQGQTPLPVRMAQVVGDEAALVKVLLPAQVALAVVAFNLLIHQRAMQIPTALSMSDCR